MPKTLKPAEQKKLLESLKTRFEKNPSRHKGIAWGTVQAKLEANADKLWSLSEMERTGGEPDVVGMDKKTKEILFVDCSKESPSDRRSVCYDEPARKARKKHPPEHSALQLAAAMGADLLTEEEYRQLQELGAFDNTTSSWLTTPPAIRKLGGAIFGDFRYGTVFVYHNGADSYYAARGFRCVVRV